MEQQFLTDLEKQLPDDKKVALDVVRLKDLSAPAAQQLPLRCWDDSTSRLNSMRSMRAVPARGLRRARTRPCSMRKTGGWKRSPVFFHARLLVPHRQALSGRIDPPASFH